MKLVPYRPCPLSAGVITKIGRAMEKGVPFASAALLGGLEGPQARKLLKRGRELQQALLDKGAMPEGTDKADWMSHRLALEVEKAHAVVVSRYARRIDRAVSKSWGAAAWWLDRRAKEEMTPKEDEAAPAPTSAEGGIQVVLPDNGRSA